MNKGIKRIIAMTLVVSALTAIEPVKYLNLMTTQAYAADYGISSLKVLKGTKTSSIGLYKDEDYEDETTFKKSLTQYYGETVESSIKIIVEENSGYETKIFKSSSSTADAYDSGDKIPISKGETVLYVRTYEDGEFDEDNVKKNKINEYKININRIDEDDEDEDYISNKIYLEDIELSDGEIDFSRKTSKYNISVKNSVSNITITATPEDDEDSVKIGGKTVTESAKYKRKIALEVGKNEVEVRVFNEYDEKERIYNLIITRAKEDSSNISNDSNNNYDSDGNDTNVNTNTNTNTNTDTNTNTNTTEQPNVLNKNKWIKDSTNKWKYYDENGKVLTSQWLYDKTYWKWYYFDETGYMKTGWLFLNNTWYYLNEGGAMKTGWHYDHNSWYYLNGDGSMRTGWLQENNKKYYLSNNGAMQVGVKTIDGKSYTFNSSGVLQ